MEQPASVDHWLGQFANENFSDVSGSCSTVYSHELAAWCSYDGVLLIATCHFPLASSPRGTSFVVVAGDL